MSNNYYAIQLCKRTRNGADGRSKCVDEWCAPIYNIETFVTNPRHDEGFDTAEVSYFTKTSLSIREWRKVRLWEGDNFSDWWVESYDSEQIVYGAEPVYRKKLKLIELTKVLEKRPMRNLNFSRNVDGTARYTMRSMLNKVIYHMFTVLEIDRDTIPLKIELDSTIQGLDNDAPEMFFTEKTALEIFIEIGEVLGGFPRLLPRNVDTGKYVLTYDMWDNPNAEKHTVSNVNSVTVHRGIDGFADIVESNVKNCISGDDKNYSVYPCEGEYKGVNAEEYETEITNDNAVFTLPRKIYTIKKMEVKGYYKGADNKIYTFLRDITDCVIEYNEWKTLSKARFYQNYEGSKQGFIYYKQGTKDINIKNLQRVLSVKGSPSAIDAVYCRIRVAYVPICEIVYKKEKMNRACLPIIQVVNQISNVTQAKSYGAYLQGLINRMIGEYKITEIITKRGKPLLKVGDYLNGEIITEALHQHGNQFVNSLYTTSKEFNRRSQFVGVPCEVRQWQIPDDEKVSDTIIHYAEEVVWSLCEPVEKKDNSSLTEHGKTLYLSSYLGAENIIKPSLAYLAFKTEEEIMESGVKDCTKYAMVSLNVLSANNSIFMEFACGDNYYTGLRSFNEGEIDEEYKTNRQRSIPYQDPELNVNYLQIKISDAIPSTYDFSEESSLTAGGTESKTYNKLFESTFPMSNTTQFLDCQPLIDFSTLTHYVNAEEELDYIATKPDNLFKIDKDLRDIIKFVYQLDNVAESDTILSRIVAENNAFCGGVGVGLEVVVMSEQYYFRADTNIASVPKSTFAATVTHDGENKKIVFSGGGIVFGSLTEGILNKSIAITDKSSNIYWATNNLKNVEQTIETDEQGRKVLNFAISLYYDIRKKEYKCM